MPIYTFFRHHEDRLVPAFSVETLAGPGYVIEECRQIFSKHPGTERVEVFEGDVAIASFERDQLLTLWTSLQPAASPKMEL
jgi:hypothetical protein